MTKVVFFYQNFASLLRILVVGTSAYAGLLIFLRISGKRTLAQLNAFDFVITIAIGSTLGRLITAQGVSLAESLMAFCTLIFLQYLISWLTNRSSTFKQWVTAQPSLLYFRGEFLPRMMARERVTQAQLLAAVRENRMGSLQEVEAIILESTGKITVIQKGAPDRAEDVSALQNVPQVNQTPKG